LAYLSPGVYVKEVDASAIVPTVSNAMAFFAGEFEKGPLEEPFVITNKKELEEYFGEPNDQNYNQWFQCYKYFDYSNQLTIVRAYSEDQIINTGVTVSLIGTDTVIRDLTEKEIDYIRVGSTLYIGNYMDEPLTVVSISKNSQGGSTLYDVYVTDHTSDLTGELKILTSYMNAGIDAYRDDTTMELIPESQDYDLYKNYEDFVFKLPTISFFDNVKIKFIAKDPGLEGIDIDIAICNPIDFIQYEADNGSKYTSQAEAFEGISLDGLFQYAPINNEVGIVIRDEKNDYIETFVVSFDVTAQDGNGRSMYIEDVINENSRLLYAVNNDALTDLLDFQQPVGPGFKPFSTYIQSHIYKDSQGNLLGENNAVIKNSITTYGGIHITPTVGDIYDAYFEVQNKELYDIDVVIGNEVDEGDAAIALAEDRSDCIAFIGARYSDVVGKRAAEATKNLADYMLSPTAPMRTMFASFFGNYFKIYDNYAKRYRYINVAGDMAGLRCQTNTNQASWWASAGLQRGRIRNIDRIAFSPNQDQRDQLYKNSINPIVNFPGEGNLVWGQKTLLNYASSFDRINVRGLFNTLERAMAKAAKSQVFEFNDSYTRNSILAMFNPYLATVKAGRGIDDFLVICDETNNTPDIISRNQLNVDIYIKPMYAAEFIQLTFTNVGTRSFASVIGA
jgi:hypothetical protein